MGKRIPEDARHTIVQYIAAQHQSIDRHVLQLFCAVRALLLQGVPVARRTQEPAHGRLPGCPEYSQAGRWTDGIRLRNQSLWQICGRGCTGCLYAQGQGAVELYHNPPSTLPPQQPTKAKDIYLCSTEV